ncbi:hypothetical protein SNOG_01543 [Parastagonospora nodorum SN15]|uniref:Uncharacterized protein n=1 Tax=Phaeosphaeria nodorum (strain SN15 / ATCC MYA-4574 / FGSC 10173) TaxID=321614 RepID=Q0V371_PHANO|nr:hypothetical protein SNOG_01543 [Parastagonospora nodorum SN15]EAT91192.1 hypothetical protein SNOG_01543 [Parastagonospora nodorum SN15]
MPIFHPMIFKPEVGHIVLALGLNTMPDNCEQHGPS